MTDTVAADGRAQPARPVVAAVRDMHPSVFAFVMATSIISTATFLLGPAWLSRALLVIAVAALAVLSVAELCQLAFFRSKVVADIGTPEQVFGFFSIAAALDVIGGCG
jgi:tellurite resistance protein TehA-like permease